MNQKKFKKMVHNGRSSLAKDVLIRFMNNKAAMVGAVLLAIVLFALIFADVIVPYEKVTAYDSAARLQSPNFRHLFGTDNLGRDLFARIVHGSRISVGIGVGATLVSLCVAAAIASVCAMSKKADFVIMRIIDVVSCVPSILLALMFLAIMGGSVLNMMITLTIISVPSFVLHIRSVILSIVEQDYIAAARVSGSSAIKIVLKHVLPNAINPIIVEATMMISAMMLSAAGLSFIGVGVAPPSPEWGAMLNYAQGHVRTAPYMAIIPGLAICVTALAINLVGDGLRDALDPKTGK